MAEQQGKWLAKMLNQQAKAEPGWQPTEGFVYKSLGSMASVGGRSAVLQVEVSAAASAEGAAFKLKLTVEG